MVSLPLPPGSAASPRPAPPGRLRLGVAPAPVEAVSFLAGRSGLPPRGLSPGSTDRPLRVSTMCMRVAEGSEMHWRCAVSPALAPPFHAGCRPRHADLAAFSPQQPRSILQEGQ